MAQLIAVLSQNNTETQILSEANCMRYRLAVSASHLNAVPVTAGIVINGITQNVPRLRGMNIYEISGGTVINAKRFEITNTESTMNNAFLTTLKGYTTGVYVICSHEVYCTSPLVDQWFSSVGSVAKQGSAYATKFPNSAYVCVYNADKKLIMQENFVGNDGVLVEDSRAFLDFVYDASANVGSTGIPKRIISDWVEGFISRAAIAGIAIAGIDVAGSGIKSYGNNSEDYFLLSDYNLVSGDYVISVAHVLQSQEMIDGGGEVLLEINWMNGSTVIRTDQYPADKVSTQVKLEKIIQIPASSDRFTVGYRFVGTEGSCKIVSAFMSYASSPARTATTYSEIGVNGIRATQFNDAQSSYILELPDNKTHTPINIITGNEFKEI